MTHKTLYALLGLDSDYGLLKRLQLTTDSKLFLHLLHRSSNPLYEKIPMLTKPYQAANSKVKTIEDY